MEIFESKKILITCIFSFFAFVLSSQAMAQAVKEPVPKLNPTVINGLQLGINPQITNNTKPTITGTINHPNASVYIIVNNHSFRGTNNGDGSWAVGVSEPLPNGTYDVMAIATPPLGNQVAMKVAKVLLIDTVAPKATIESLTTVNPSPALTGTTDDANAIVVVKVNKSLYAAKNNGDGTWTLPTGTISPDLKPGSYEITVLAGDLAGNLGTTSQGTLIISGKEEAPSSDSMSD